MVHFKNVLRLNNVYNDMPNANKFVLGIDTNNSPVVSSLQKAIHILIAGSSGGGKSTALHTVICSLLQNATPNNVKFFFADFCGGVELEEYVELPHAGAPLISDKDTLRWTLDYLVGQMEERQQKLKASGKKHMDDGDEAIVLVIDEIAEAIMSAGAKKLEDMPEIYVPLTRLAQAGRKCGIHLILTTQHPRQDIIPTLIRNNLPTRVCTTTKTSSQSKVVIDEPGGEKLAYKGDAFIDLPYVTKLQRVQTPWINDETRSAIIDFWKSQVP